MVRKVFYVIGVILLVLGCFVGLSWLTSMKNMVIYQDANHEVKIEEIPYLSWILAMCSEHYSGQATLTIFSYDSLARAKLHFGYVRPKFFLYSPEKKAVLIMYFADLSYQFLVVEHKNSDIDRSLDRFLMTLVEPLNEETLIRHMTLQELEDFAFVMESLSEKEYRKRSLPTIDIGVYKDYVPQKFLLDILAKEIKKQTKKSNQE